jgi:uncharacterized protein YndB with AHSA1/START domain
MRPERESAELSVVADTQAGHITATIDIAAPPERVFRALTSEEIVDWWVRPGVFDTRTWTGDVRVGGRWRASGLSRGQPYILGGEYLEVDPPRKLVHTWHLTGLDKRPTTVTFTLEQVAGGTRLTLLHSGFSSPDRCTNNRVGWESSLRQLLNLLGPN